ncbi:GIY-YIG nuclease family protein [Streptomyces sp. NPDC096153]|uniref:GIY-YIG nuclease family protein n=1 Tax=Streptomyces sp. NPDC096153 TaxID=3155548 RepID=UPI003332685B
MSGERVYVIGGDDLTRCKIGYAAGVRDRLASLNVASPFPLRVLATFGGGRPLESDLHHYFHPWRVHGEWFEFGELDAVELVTQAVAAVGEGQFGRRLPQRWSWPSYDDARPHFLTEAEMQQGRGGDAPRCVCGHQQATHNPPPHPPECIAEISMANDFCLCGRFEAYAVPLTRASGPASIH